jgi:hypothetical protein
MMLVDGDMESHLLIMLVILRLVVLLSLLHSFPDLHQELISLEVYITWIREVGHVSRIGYVSDTDTHRIRGRYVSVKK